MTRLSAYRVFSLVLVIVGCSSGIACTPALVSTQTPFMENVGDIEMSSRELRVRVIEFGRYFSATVEQSADRILVTSSDPAERRYALLWKARAIPAAQEAVLQIDPLMALVDIWAFAMQMEVFFESGPGKLWFTEGRSEVLATAGKLVGDAHSFAVRISVSGDVDAPEQEIRGWVNNHPIEDDLFLRDSVIGSGANLLGSQRGAFALVEDMNTTTREVGYRLAFYNEYLLKQVRWALELGGDDLLRVPRIDSLLTAVQHTLSIADGLTSEFDALAARERDALLTSAGQERAIVLAELNRQRIALLSTLSDERAIVLDAVSRERIAAMAAIRSEREATIETLASAIEDAKLESRAIVDYAVYRFGILLGAGLAIVLLFAFVVVLMLRRSFAA
ncbi:MAG: hypothetical protein HKN13_10560 [Rhodothermales bacterium]|nr:hypothetical protein [Rhodothermales bacterium]